MKALLLVYASTLLLGAAPRLHPVPVELVPYWHCIMNEPIYARWLFENRHTLRPLLDFIEDGSQPVLVRQRAWQFKRKLEYKK